ncbi:hypothetical protein AABB24_005251, partial [Solanum stoloniferum]
HTRPIQPIKYNVKQILSSEMGRVDELGFNLGCFNLPFLRVYMDSPQPGMESEKQINDEEVKSVIEVMAASGKYWHDWDKLKGMLSFHLKQVLSDYPEAKMTIEQQQSCLGESLPELAKRLDDEHIPVFSGFVCLLEAKKKSHAIEVYGSPKIDW